MVKQKQKLQFSNIIILIYCRPMYGSNTARPYTNPIKQFVRNKFDYPYSIAEKQT